MKERDDKGKFGQGNPGKPKGAKNKSMTRLRIAELIEDSWPKFLKELSTLRGKAYVEAITKLLPFHMPTYSAVNFNLRNMSEDDLQYLIEKLKEQNNYESDTSNE